MLTLERDGACHLPGLLSGEAANMLKLLQESFENSAPGIRLIDNPELSQAVSALLELPQLMAALGGAGWQCVRAIAFDKKPSGNWSLGWHQDRTIAVKSRMKVPGFGPWSVKQGIDHVDPPFATIDAMRTLRVHFDPVDDTNGALMIARGSHLMGKIPVFDADRTARKLPTFSCHAQAGDGWLYRTPILHASKRSTSLVRRRVLQLDLAQGALPQPLEWRGI